MLSKNDENRYSCLYAKGENLPFLNIKFDVSYMFFV